MSSGAWEEAMSKAQGKVKELEEKYNGIILENGVSFSVPMAS